MATIDAGMSAQVELSCENRRLTDMIDRRNKEVVRLSSELNALASAESSTSRPAPPVQSRYWTSEEHQRFLQVLLLAILLWMKGWNTRNDD